jgi:hypothetical protein
MSINPMRSALAAFFGTVLLALSAGNVHGQENGAGPMSLIIAYQCPAANKAAFRAHMAGAGIERFERWKSEGVYKDYLVLFSAFTNAGPTAPDMMVRLDFSRYADSAKWKLIERESPAGLSASALALCSPISSYLTDLKYTGTSAKRDLSKAVYLWIPYHLEKKVSKSAYKRYFEVYVKPQNEGWLAEGALSWWGVYFNQHVTGSPWDMLFLYEYANIDGMAARDNVKEAVRAKLRADPVWKAASDNKLDMRIEDQVIVMDPILPPRK